MRVLKNHFINKYSKVTKKKDILLHFECEKNITILIFIVYKFMFTIENDIKMPLGRPSERSHTFLVRLRSLRKLSLLGRHRKVGRGGLYLRRGAQKRVGGAHFRIGFEVFLLLIQNAENNEIQVDDREAFGMK